ncbi:MAG: sigma-54-dependent transcriptional regulator [Gemmatimonadales bacterium]
MRVLLLDADDSLRHAVAPSLEDVGYEVIARRDPEAALLEAQACGIRTVVCDLALPNDGGLAFLRRYRAGGGTGIVLVCGGPTESAAAASALREGADGFLRKPAIAEEVLLALRQADERERLRHEVATLRATIGAKGLEPMLVAEDSKMRSILEVAARAAASDQTILITGERGTGKALLARAMHRFSRRGDGAFVAIDCTATPDFFTAAGGEANLSPSDPQSVWRSASRGTLLLEEVEALTRESQTYLVSRLGAGRPGNGRQSGSVAVVDNDVRIMATTEMAIDRLLNDGKIQPDLAKGLGMTTLDLPALRDRRDDIPALVTHFLQQVASKTARPISITPQAMSALVGYSWPGNVRELRQVVERAAVLSPSGKLDRSDFPVLVSAGRANGNGASEYALKPQVEAFEREIILRALAACGGTRREAARLLRISLRTLFYKLRRYGLA